MGLSTGLLAAAAVALSPAVPALIPLAVEVVLIAFRLGLHIEKTAKNVESSHNTEGASWSYVVPGKTEAEAQAALDLFHSEKVTTGMLFQGLNAYFHIQIMPISNHAYVSASTSNSTTISGPPTTLTQFFETSISFTKDHLALPVNGPYHAQHLHNGLDAKNFLRSTNTKASHILPTYRLALPLISTSTGQCFDEKLEASALLASIIEDILKQPFHLEKVVDGCTNLANGLSKYTMISFGPNSAESMIIKALESETNATVEIHEASPANIPQGLTAFGDAPRTSRRPKLAIVGMAGRFPNAADHEKFWDLLEAGLDVHKRV